MDYEGMFEAVKSFDSILAFAILWLTFRIKGRQWFVAFITPIIEKTMKDPLEDIQTKQADVDKEQTKTFNGFRDSVKVEVGAVATKLGKQIDHAESRIKENNALIYAKATDVAELKGMIKKGNGK